MDMKKLGPMSNNVKTQSEENRVSSALWWIEMNKLLKGMGKPALDAGMMQKPDAHDPILNDPNFLDRVQGIIKGRENARVGKQRTIQGTKGDRQLPSSKLDKEPPKFKIGEY